MSTERDRHSALERQVHEMLRALPMRRAPGQLSARVWEQLASRAAAPWWRRSFWHWPWPMRSVFLAVCLALIGASVLGAAAAPAHVPALNGVLAGAHLHFAAGIGHLAASVNAALALLSALSRVLPSAWLEALAVIAGAAYVLLFGLGAAAYRLLTVQH
jgi:hypothetical protein